MQHQTPPAHPTFREALAFWLRLGFISFGGPAGQIAIMHAFLVEQKRWISPSKFLHALNYCMLLPGPEAQQLATYTGWMLHGTRGGLAAGLLFVLPSALVLWGLSALYVTYGQLPAIQAVFDLLKPAVVAIVVGAIVKIGKKSLRLPLHYAVAAVAFVAIYFLQIPFPLIVLGAIAVGVAAYFWGQRNGTPSQTLPGDPEPGYLIQRDTVVSLSGFRASRLLKQAGVALLLWGLPLLAFCWFVPAFGFWKNLVLFFTKAALVTFGGAYAVLPYVAQVSVEQFGWLSRLQMLDGLALGETTPGPLIMVLAFVGFMAGYNNFGGSLAMATLGQAVTVFYTFLPSFLFVLAGAPLIERTHTNPAVQSILQYATAAVSGVMLSLCLYLGQAVILPHPPDVQWIALTWVLVSLAALQYFNINMIAWVGVSIAAGLIKYWCFGVLVF